MLNILLGVWAAVGLVLFGFGLSKRAGALGALGLALLWPALIPVTFLVAFAIELHKLMRRGDQ